MKKKFLSILLIISSPSLLADFGDSIAKVIFQKKVDQTYERALLCNPLEVDSKSSMDVTAWMKIQPDLPSWQLLADIEKTAKEAREYAKSRGGNDKFRHCLAGCYVAQQLDFKSAVLVGWYKELSDASDCSKNTTFEKKDYEATVKGARLSINNKSCEKICP